MKVEPSRTQALHSLHARPTATAHRIKLSTLFLCCAAACGTASTSAFAAKPGESREALRKRIEVLEKRLGEMSQALAELKARPAPEAVAPRAAAAVAAPAAAVAQGVDSVADKLSEIDQRLTAVETNTVQSEPKMIVKEVAVYVDENGNQYDTPTPGAKPTVSYQRERVFRRQSISEEIEEALSSVKKEGIRLGLSNVTTAQMAFQTEGVKTPANRHLYGFSAVDINLQATSAALNTTFYADLVGIGGSPPDREIPTINLLNAQTARLSNNQLSLREAWIQTQVFDKRLSLTLGRVDLTNYFDHNAVANDEASRFINDALVNNPVLGLTTNGLGLVAVYDPKIGLNAKLGVQQSKDDATSLSTARFVLGEVEYLARPFSLPEGHYRLWARQDNSTGTANTGYGLSIDQKITPAVTLFGRYGRGFVGAVDGRMRFVSGGIGFQAPLTFYPLDTWGIGYADTKILTGPNANSERVAEGFYNFRLTGSLSLSVLLQYLNKPNSAENYLLPAMRLQASF